jgi:hypothetical protein
MLVEGSQLRVASGHMLNPCGGDIRDPTTLLRRARQDDELNGRFSVREELAEKND